MTLETAKAILGAHPEHRRLRWDGPPSPVELAAFQRRLARLRAQNFCVSMAACMMKHLCA